MKGQRVGLGDRLQNGWREVSQRCLLSRVFLAFSFFKHCFQKPINLCLPGPSPWVLLCFKMRKTHHTVGSTPARNRFVSGGVTWGDICHGLICVPWPVCAHLDLLPISRLKACLVWPPSGWSFSSMNFLQLLRAFWKSERFETVVCGNAEPACAPSLPLTQQLGLKLWHCHTEKGTLFSACPCDVTRSRGVKCRL